MTTENTEIKMQRELPRYNNYNESPLASRNSLGSWARLFSALPHESLSLILLRPLIESTALKKMGHPIFSYKRTAANMVTVILCDFGPRVLGALCPKTCFGVLCKIAAPKIQFRVLILCGAPKHMFFGKVPEKSVFWGAVILCRSCEVHGSVDLEDGILDLGCIELEGMPLSIPPGSRTSGGDYCKKYNLHSLLCPLLPLTLPTTGPQKVV